MIRKKVMLGKCLHENTYIHDGVFVGVVVVVAISSHIQVTLYMHGLCNTPLLD